MKNGSSSAGALRACLVATFSMAGLLLGSATYAAPPPPAAVSVYAGLKQLNFFWNRVAGATRYELWFLPATGGTWVKYATLPGSRTSLAIKISGHLLQWEQSRYVVKSCGPSGCSN